MADIATLQATDMLTAATNSNASDIFIIDVCEKPESEGKRKLPFF